MNATEVRALFKNGTPMMRVLTLGLMRGDPSLADELTIVSAIADSRSANEQFQGLTLALLCWHTLARSDRTAIQSAIKDSPYIPDPGLDRQSLADQLLALPGLVKTARFLGRARRSRTVEEASSRQKPSGLWDAAQIRRYRGFPSGAPGGVR